MKTYKVVVSGKVQGVGFRAYAKKTALQFGLKGWVTNLPSGEVELLLQGDESKIESMLQWCNRGPGISIVDKTIFEEINTEKEYETFEVIK
jgi:acylphosphatase